MSLEFECTSKTIKLVWDTNATAYTDHNLQYVVINVLCAKPETFHIGQIALLDAFRSAIVHGLIGPSEIALEVDGATHTFNQYGNFSAHGPWPVPDLPSKIVCGILQGQCDKKRAAKAERSVV